jgi:hypothetical protein
MSTCFDCFKNIHYGKRLNFLDLKDQIRIVHFKQITININELPFLEIYCADIVIMWQPSLNDKPICVFYVIMKTRKWCWRIIFIGVLTVAWLVETLITWTYLYTYKQTPASYWEQGQYLQINTWAFPYCPGYHPETLGPIWVEGW